METIPVDHDPFATAVTPAPGYTHEADAPIPGAVQKFKDIAAALKDWVVLPGRVLGTYNDGRDPPTEEERMNWAHGTALGMTGLSRLPGGAPAGALGTGGSKLVQPDTLAARAAPGSPGIIAHHASPYDFDRFDFSKIGSGEGAQSYGHGGYFAGNPAVSDNYFGRFAARNALGAPRTIPVHVRDALNEMDNLGFDNAGQAMGALRQDFNAGNDWRALWDFQHPGDAARATIIEDYLKAKRSTAAHRYEVNINARPEELLNWDAPGSAQPPAVKEALADLLSRQRGVTREAVNIDSAPSGGIAYRNIAGTFSPRYASDSLKERGVPGIQYYDQMSRHGDAAQLENSIASTKAKIAQIKSDLASNGTNAELLPAYYRRMEMELNHHQGWLDSAEAKLAALPPQTRNYVVFDDSLITIMRKYGVAGLSMVPPAVAAKAAANLVPVDHDPFAQ